MVGLVFDISLRIVAAAAAVGLVLFVMRVRSGAARHAAWSAVLAAMLTMPVLIAIVPPVRVAMPAAFDGGLAAVAGPPDRPPAVPASTDGERLPPPRLPSVLDSGALSAPQASSSSVFGWGRVATALYATGLVFFAVRLWGGWCVARRLVAGASRADLENPFPVFESPAVAAPLTAGIVRPSVLLPTAWREWPDETLRAVLAHENAHIARRDSLVAALAHVNRTLFWFHPLAWWLERRLAVTAEHACDEAAARDLGEPRRYAAILLDMADAVRRQRGRVMWPAIGVGGSGVLGARIDRLVRGDALVPMSRARQAVTSVACVAALGLALACRQQISPTTLGEDPTLAARLAADLAATTRFEASRDMAPAEVDALEARIAERPDDWDARERLVTYYRMGRAVPWDKKVPGLRRHALWLIEHHPEHDVQAPPLSPEYDPDGFAAATRLWETHLQQPGVSPYLVSRASQFFVPYDKPRAEQLILRGLALDPDSGALRARMPPHFRGYEWPTQLASLYGAALVGAEDVGRRFNAERANSPFAISVRQRLDPSSDPAMLTGVGSYLVRAGLGTGGEITALGRSYLERALQLDPDLLNARVALVGMRVRERNIRFNEARSQGRSVADADRLAHEAYLAEFGYITAESAEYYGKVAANGTTRRDAVAHAEQALRLAAERRQEPTYSSSVAAAHFVLSASASRDGDREKAVRHLQEAARVPASEELSYSPSPGLGKAVNALLKAGERDRVVEFLEAYSRLSILQRDRLLQDAKDIREGRMPMAYQYMVARETKRPPGPRHTPGAE